MNTIDKEKLGWFLVIASIITAIFLCFNSSILNPDNELYVVATTLYKNILLFMLLNWLFVLGIFLIKKEK